MAGAVQGVLEAKGVQQLVAERFAVGVELYPIGLARRRRYPRPFCSWSATRTTVSRQRVFSTQWQDIPAGPFPIKIEILPGAGHRFDDPRFADAGLPYLRTISDLPFQRHDIDLQ